MIRTTRTEDLLATIAAVYQAYSGAFREPHAESLDLEKLREAYGVFPGGADLPMPPVRPPEDQGWFGHNLSPDGPPYETQYGKSDVFRQTHVLADLAGFYQAFGVGLAAGDRRPDHLPVELEFAALLCFKEAAAREKGNEAAAEVCRQARKRFLAEHLLRWVPAFAEAVERKGGSASACGTVNALAAFVDWDARHVGVDLVADPVPVVRQEPLEDRCQACLGGGDDETN